jgi:hypothetical protein
MKTEFFLIIAVSLTPLAAVAQPIGWHDYVVPESGAVAQIPTDIFSEDGGKPDSGYGRRFFTSSRRANLTVQSIPNDANDTPAVSWQRNTRLLILLTRGLRPALLWCPAIGKTKSGTIAAILRPIL